MKCPHCSNSVDAPFKWFINVGPVRKCGSCGGKIRFKYFAHQVISHVVIGFIYFLVASCYIDYFAYFVIAVVPILILSSFYLPWKYGIYEICE